MSKTTTHASQGLRMRRLKGFTLIELLVTVTIIGVLSAIAVPSYVQYMTRTKRTIGKTLLLQIADRQEQFFADNKSYAPTLSALGFSADKFAVDDKGAVVASSSSDRVYVVGMTNISATTFTAVADPQLTQASRDIDCQTLTLTHTGVRGQTGSATNCW